MQWSDVWYVWIRRINIAKMFHLPKLVCRSNAFPMKTPAGLCIRFSAPGGAAGRERTPPPPTLHSRESWPTNHQPKAPLSKAPRAEQRDAQGVGLGALCGCRQLSVLHVNLKHRKEAERPAFAAVTCGCAVVIRGCHQNGHHPPHGDSAVVATDSCCCSLACSPSLRNKGTLPWGWLLKTSEKKLNPLTHQQEVRGEKCFFLSKICLALEMGHALVQELYRELYQAPAPKDWKALEGSPALLAPL